MASDLISRKVLINKFWEYTNGGKQRYLIPEDIWEMVELMPTVDSWIPCSERLPKEEGMYLITSNLFGSLEVQYVFYSENVQMFVCNGTPVAWMPLPEPYKAGDIDG